MQENRPNKFRTIVSEVSSFVGDPVFKPVYGKRHSNLLPTVGHPVSSI